MAKLSRLSNRIDGQPMFKILERVQELERIGKRVIHFELGEPDFDTPTHISDAAINAINNGETHYAPSSGIYDFKKAVIETTKLSRGFEPDLNQILVAPGANSIIYLAMKCILDPDDEVLIPDPGFPTYFSAANACGATIVPVKLNAEDKFKLSLQDLKTKISGKTKLIILNSPSNPTGAVLEQEDIEQVYKLCTENDIYLLSDEVYARMIFNGSKFFSPSQLDMCKERTIVLNGFSKTFSMTGWRLGVAIGPSDLIERVGLLTSTIVSCVAPFVQRAGIAALRGPQEPVYEMINEYAVRGRLLAKGLNEVKGVKCAPPDGAIYVFADVRETGLSSQEFSSVALEQCGVATTPGVFFGDNGEGFVRFSVVTSQEEIRLALEALKEYFNAN